MRIIQLIHNHFQHPHFLTHYLGSQWGQMLIWWNCPLKVRSSLSYLSTNCILRQQFRDLSSDFTTSFRNPTALSVPSQHAQASCRMTHNTIAVAGLSNSGVKFLGELPSPQPVLWTERDALRKWLKQTAATATAAEHCGWWAQRCDSILAPSAHLIYM